jgi:hypothetical protein
MLEAARLDALHGFTPKCSVPWTKSIRLSTQVREPGVLIANHNFCA